MSTARRTLPPIRRSSWKSRQEHWRRRLPPPRGASALAHPRPATVVIPVREEAEEVARDHRPTTIAEVVTIKQTTQEKEIVTEMDIKTRATTTLKAIAVLGSTAMRTLTVIDLPRRLGLTLPHE